jgi:hypothetical protein
MKFSEERASKQRRKESLAHRPYAIKALASKSRVRKARHKRIVAENIRGSHETAEMDQADGSQSKAALELELSPKLTRTSVNTRILSMARSGLWECSTAAESRHGAS